MGLGSGLRITFYGVRGSTPCSDPRLCRYGGNTSCVVLERPGEPPIILDMGTGLRHLGGEHNGSPGFEGSILLSHLHWDHVQGLPFFGPIHESLAGLTIYGPPHSGRSLCDLFSTFMAPPYFPVCHHDLGGRVDFEDVWNERFEIGSALVVARSVPHTGETSGYRVEWGGFSVAYVSDHQEPLDRPQTVATSVLELADGVDVLIHDAQFTRAELL